MGGGWILEGMNEPDLDLRVIRYFVCVAELEGFGRAAAELHVSQPSLSRQIRGLERELGRRLFDRVPAGARLTPAGAAFLPHARGLLRSARTAIAAAAGQPEGLTVGYSPGLDIAPVVRELRVRCPEAEIRTTYLGWRRPAEPLLAAEVDAVVARLPFEADGLDVDELYHEPRVVAMHRGHPLADRLYFTAEDIADLPRPNPPGLEEASRTFWGLGSATSASATAMAGLDDTWQRVSLGDIVAIVSPSHARLAGPDTVLIPLRGVPPARVVVAVRAGDRSPLVAQFRDCARAMTSQLADASRGTRS